MAESVLKKVRARWTDGIMTPKENTNDDGSKSHKYNVVVLVPKKDKAVVDQIKKEIKATIEANGNWTAKQKQEIYSIATSAELGGVYNRYCILKDGDAYNERRADDKKTADSSYSGMYYLSFSRNSKAGAPQVVGQDGKTPLNGVDASTLLVPGCWINLQYSFYAWSNKIKGASGCSAQFSAVMYYKAGDPFPRENKFTAVPEEELSEESETFSE